MKEANLTFDLMSPIGLGPRGPQGPQGIQGPMTQFANPVEWSNTRSYDPLTIVTYQGNSYTSRKRVPKGIDINDAQYWVETGNYNAQVEAYRQETLNFVNSIQHKAFAFENVSEMQNSTQLYVGAICHTNGFHESGDGGAAWYVISDAGIVNGMDVLECDIFNAILVYDSTIDVATLGAIGNGAYNCSPMVRRAIELAAPSFTQIANNESYVQSKTVCFGRGSYLLKDPITLEGYVSIQGLGVDSTVLVYDGALTESVITIDGLQSDGFYQTKYAHVSGLTIDAKYNAGSCISNKPNNTWIDSCAFSDLLLVRTNYVAMYVCSCWCSEFTNITINCCAVGAYFGENANSNGFNNNTIRGLNIHNIGVCGLVCSAQNSVFTIVNVDRTNSFNRGTATPASVIINGTTYNNDCAIAIVKQIDTCEFDGIWLEFIDSQYGILIKDIRRYNNRPYGRNVTIKNIHIGTHIATCVKMLDGYVEIRGIRGDNVDVYIDTDGALVNSSLLVNGMTSYSLTTKSNITLPYGSYKAVAVEPNGALVTLQNTYHNMIKLDDDTNVYDVVKNSSLITHWNVDNCGLFADGFSWNSNMFIAYGRDADSHGYFDTGHTAISGYNVGAVFIARNAASMAAVSTPHWIQASTLSNGHIGVRMSNESSSPITIPDDGLVYIYLYLTKA